MPQSSHAQWMILDRRYDQIGELGDPCAYCGVESDSWDHVPPLHFVARTPEDESSQLHLRKVPACVQCNSWLGGVVLTSMDARRDLIRHKMRKKYAHVLRIPEWTDEDLHNLSNRLADEIRRHLYLANHVRRRLGFYR